jgi:predicted MFS family arabinose efflux permease
MRSRSTLVYRFYAYRALVAEGFVYPIITIYALAQGLGLADIGLATGAFFLGILLGEVPTGYIGDRIGRRNSLVLGAAMISLTHVGFALADTLVAFVSLYAFWGVASTFRSGSADAWLYDVLAERDAAETYTHVRGRATSAFYVSAATTALLGGVLYEIRPSFPFLAAAGVTALAAIVVATLPEPGVTQESDGFSFAEARAALSTVVSNRRIGAFVGLSAVVLAVPETIEIFVQPVMLDMGVRPAMLGPLYAGLMVAAAIGSSQADGIKRWLGTARWFTVGPAVLAGVLLLAVLVPVVAVPAFFLARGVNTATDTLGSTFLNDLLASHGRATALSGVSMVYALANFLARTAGGAAASLTSPLVALAAFGCLAVIALVGIRAVADPFVKRRTTKQTR